MGGMEHTDRQSDRQTVRQTENQRRKNADTGNHLRDKVMQTMTEIDKIDRDRQTQQT